MRDVSTREPLPLDALDLVALKWGSHGVRSLDTLCMLEAVAWVAGREHTDEPPCVSPIISAFLRSWNDALNDEDRQILKPLVPRVINTVATPEIELRRSWMALDWYCRVATPAWLRLAGLTAEAKAIEVTSPIVDDASASAAQAALSAASAAGDAAWSAAASAGWSATASAAASAAVSAAWSAAWSAAGDAAVSAAVSAAWSAAWSAARSAAGDAARSTAGSAAWSAAASAASAHLRPVVVHLQASALDLVERMIALSTTEAES